MKEFVKFFGCIVLGVVLYSLVHTLGCEESGECTMVYNVYYNNTPKTYVLHNDLPIRVDSHRGTNLVRMFKHGGFLTCDEVVTVLCTSAPIEVVSYTVKNKEK